VFFLGSLWETRGGLSLWDLCGVGGREAGKIFEASVSLLKVASFFLSLFCFFGPFGGVLLLCGELDWWVRYLCFFSFELQLLLF
jgi:hypothetical protein